MKLLSSLRNPETKKYTINYFMVLAMASTTILLTTFHILHQNPLSNMSYLEVGFSLFMLSRKKQVRNALGLNMSRIKDITRQSIPLSYNIGSWQSKIKYIVKQFDLNWYRKLKQFDNCKISILEKCWVSTHFIENF